MAVCMVTEVDITNPEFPRGGYPWLNPLNHAHACELSELNSRRSKN